MQFFNRVDSVVDNIVALSVFKDLERLFRVTDTSKNLEYTQEIYNAACGGSIRLDDFNLYAYEMRARQNGYKNKITEAKKKVSLIEEFSTDEVYVPGTITTASLYASKGGDTTHATDAAAVSPKMSETGYSSIEDIDTYASNLGYLLENRKTIHSQTGSDPIILLKGALSGNPMAVSKLSDICEEQPDIKEMIVDLLSSGSGRLTEELSNLM